MKTKNQYSLKDCKTIVRIFILSLSQHIRRIKLFRCNSYFGDNPRFLAANFLLLLFLVGVGFFPQKANGNPSLDSLQEELNNLSLVVNDIGSAVLQQSLEIADLKTPSNRKLIQGASDKNLRTLDKKMEKLQKEISELVSDLSSLTNTLDKMEGSMDKIELLNSQYQGTGITKYTKSK